MPPSLDPLTNGNPTSMSTMNASTAGWADSWMRLRALTHSESLADPADGSNTLPTASNTSAGNATDADVADFKALITVETAMTSAHMAHAAKYSGMLLWTKEYSRPLRLSREPCSDARVTGSSAKKRAHTLLPMPPRTYTPAVDSTASCTTEPHIMKW